MLVGTQQEVSPDELAQRVHSQQRVDAARVRQHQQELLQEYTRRTYIVIVVCLMSVGIPFCIGLIVIATVIGWTKSKENKCDRPLVELSTMLLIITCYRIFCHYCAVRYICGHRPLEQSTQPMPRRVLLYHIFFEVVYIGSKVAVLALAASSQDCHEEMPQLQNLLIAYCSASLFLTALMVIVSTVFAKIIAYMFRNGMLHGTKVAAEGTFEKQKIVKFGSPDLNGYEQCSICLEDFSTDPRQEIRQTSCSSKHVFHATCLKGWLKVGNNCPLCREVLDVSSVSSDIIGRSNEV